MGRGSNALDRASNVAGGGSVKKNIKQVRGRLLPVANYAIDSVALEISDVVVIVVVLAPAEDQEAGPFGFTHQRRITK